VVMTVVPHIVLQEKVKKKYEVFSPSVFINLTIN